MKLYSFILLLVICANAQKIDDNPTGDDIVSHVPKIDDNPSPSDNVNGTITMTLPTSSQSFIPSTMPSIVPNMGVKSTFNGMYIFAMMFMF